MKENDAKMEIWNKLAVPNRSSGVYGEMFQERCESEIFVARNFNKSWASKARRSGILTARFLFRSLYIKSGDVQDSSLGVCSHDCLHLLKNRAGSIMICNRKSDEAKLPAHNDL